MADITIKREQFDGYSRPIPRQRLIAAIEALGFDAHNTLEVNISSDSVSGVAFVRSAESDRVLASRGYLKFDFTAPIQDEEV